MHLWFFTCQLTIAPCSYNCYESPRRLREIGWLIEKKKSHIWEKLNLLMCADSRTNTNRCSMSGVICQVSGVRCHMSVVMSPVTSHMSLMLRATARDPPLLSPPVCIVGCWWCSVPRSIDHFFPPGKFFTFLSQNCKYWGQCPFITSVNFLCIIDLIYHFLKWE